MEIKYNTCKNCKGNGYVRLEEVDTKTCRECGGAGYFKPISIKQEQRPTDNHLQPKVSDGRSS